MTSVVLEKTSRTEIWINISTLIKEVLNGNITDSKVSVFINKMLSRMVNEKKYLVTIAGTLKTNSTKIKVFYFSFIYFIFILIQQIFVKGYMLGSNLTSRNIIMIKSNKNNATL